MDIMCIMYWIVVLLFIGMIACIMNMGEEYFCGIDDEDEEE